MTQSMRGRRGRDHAPAALTYVGRLVVEKKPSGRTPSAGAGSKRATGAPASGGASKSGADIESGGGSQREKGNAERGIRNDFRVPRFTTASPDRDPLRRRRAPARPTPAPRAPGPLAPTPSPARASATVP